MYNNKNRSTNHGRKMNPLNTQQSQFFITTGMPPPLAPTTVASILKTSTAPVISTLTTNHPTMSSSQQTANHMMDPNKFVTTTSYVPLLLTNQTLITNVEPIQQTQINVTNTNSPVVAASNLPLMSSNKSVVMATNNPSGNITYQVLTSPQTQNLGSVLAAQNGTVSVLLTTPATMTTGHVAAPLIRNTPPSSAPNVGTGWSQSFNSQQEILKQIVVGNNNNNNNNNINKFNTQSTSTTVATGTTLLKAAQPKLLNKSKAQSKLQQQLNSQQKSVNCDTSSKMIGTLVGKELVKTPPFNNNIMNSSLLTQAVQKLPQVSLLQNSKNKQSLNATNASPNNTKVDGIENTSTHENINETLLALKIPHEVRVGNLNDEVSLIKKSNVSGEKSLVKASHEKQDISVHKTNKNESLKAETCSINTIGSGNGNNVSGKSPEISNPNSKLSQDSADEKQESLLKTNKNNPEHSSAATSPRNQRSKSLNSMLKPANPNERRYSEPTELGKIKTSKYLELKKVSKLSKLNIGAMQSEELNTLLEEFEDEEYLESSGEKSDAISRKNTLLELNAKQQQQQNGIQNMEESEIKNPVSLEENKNIITNVIPSNKQESKSNINKEDQIKTLESDSDDDVTILPMEESYIEPIEIEDDDEEFSDTQTVPHNASPSSKDKEKCNESLLCDEQILVSSSSSISNHSLDQMSSSSSAPTKSPKCESSTISPLLKKSLTERKPTVVKEEPTSGYSTVLDMLSNFNMLNWRERLGTARGTNLKFQLNEFNLIQLHEKIPPRTRIHTAYDKPVYERDNLQMQSENGEPLIYYMCRRCNVRAPALDFLAPEFCSLYCLKRDCRKRQRDDNACILRKKQRYVVNPNNPPPLAYITQPKFRWSNYLKANYTSIAAPISLFLNPFPTGPNNFKIGMKLEAIDPENCALFCVCTVVDINGYRLKLSFDGYDSSYDFWLNADSMDIFPPGWCVKTNRILQPPKGISASKFNWGTYLSKEKATAAPRHLFTHLNSSSMTPRNPFQIGMHLEAEDLNDTGKLCVSSVADVLDDRIRIHFDGWDDCYDIIVDINSPYIHPCGWHEGRQQLVVPPDCENTAFNWDTYIRKQGTGIAASDEIFAPREPIHFRPNMKLEVVDPRNPSLIRPATVVSHKGHRVKLHLDGWPSDYCFWLEDDSPDLHPIGWCDATGHDLEPPPGFQMSKQKMPCPTSGCRGIGNAKKSFMSVHASRDCCPYVPENWRLVMEKPPRVGYDDIARIIPKQTKQNTQQSHQRLSDQQIYERLQMLDNIKTRNVFIQQDKITTSASTVDVVAVKKEDKKIGKHKVFPSSPVVVSYKNDDNSVLDVNLEICKEFLCDYGPRLQQNYTLWQKNFTFDADKIKRNPLLWSVTEVGVFVDLYLNCRQTAALFAQEDIDGQAFLLLQQNDLTERLGLKLGPAVKLYTSILQMRTLAVTKFNVGYRKT